MDTYKIGQTTVSKQEFEKVVKDLETIAGKAFDPAELEDRQLSATEVNALLDRDGSGFLQDDDFYTNPQLVGEPGKLAPLKEFYDKYHFPETPNLLTEDQLSPLWRLHFDRLHKVYLWGLKRPDRLREASDSIYRLMEKIGLTPVRFARYEDILKYLEDNGIPQNRIAFLNTAFTLIHNRKNLHLKQDTRPIALMLYASEDWNTELILWPRCLVSNFQLPCDTWTHRAGRNSSPSSRQLFPHLADYSTAMRTWTFMTSAALSALGCKAPELAPPVNTPSIDQFVRETYPVRQKDRLADIQQFCGQRGVDFKRAWTLSEKLHPTSEVERLDAVLVVGLVLSLREGQEGAFYRAGNQDFVDTVLKTIEYGGLKIKDYRGKQLEHGAVQVGYYTAYTFPEDTLKVSMELSTSRLTHLSGLLHELYHFYQDIRRNTFPVVKREEETYLKEAEYLLLRPPLNRVSSIGALEAWIVRDAEELSWSPHNPHYQALWVSFYRRTKQIAKAEEALQSLRDDLAYTYYFQTMLLPDDWNPNLRVENFLRENVSAITAQTGKVFGDPEFMQKLSSNISAMERRLAALLVEAKRDLSTYLENTPESEMTEMAFRSEMAPVLLLLHQIYMLQHVNKTIQSPNGVGPNPVVSLPQLSYDQPEIQALFQEFTFPYPFPFLSKPMDGVGGL